MKPFVVYYSKTGNTKKVAGVMAKALRTDARDVMEVKEVPKGAFLVLGSGVYGRKAGKGMMDFLQGLPKVRNGKAATFETSGEGRTPVAGKEMGAILEKRGYNVVDTFVCPGKLFYLFRRGRPSAEDLGKAGKFAEGLKKKIR